MAVFILLFAAIAFSITSKATILPFAEHTIGEFIPSTFPDGYRQESITQKQSCATLFNEFDTSTFALSPWSCALSCLVTNRARKQSSRLQGVMNTYAYFLNYDDDNGNSYKIMYPLQLCPSSIVGDFISPRGVVEHNATLQSIWNSLSSLSADKLYNYTLTMLKDALHNHEAAISLAICDSPSGTGKRMPRYNPSDVSGNWIYYISGTPGIFGLAFGILYVPIAKPGSTANLTGLQQTAIIATASTVGTFYFVGLRKLHKREWTNIIEAFILTLVVSAGKAILALFQHLWQGTCIGAASLAQAIGLLHQQTQQNAMVVGDGNQANQHGVEMVPPNNPAAPLPDPQQVRLGNVCS